MGTGEEENIGFQLTLGVYTEITGACSSLNIHDAPNWK